MKQFDAYAKYYDVLYGDKDYSMEAAYLASILKRTELPADASLLEIGCGTGKHAESLAQRGFRMYGIDQSAPMVEQARRRVPAGRFHVADATDFSLAGEHFDAAFSFFHVMSYVPTSADLKRAFASVAAHLAPGGLFVFDCWNLPAVEKDPPVVRFKKMSDADVDVFRTAVPVMDLATKIITIEFYVWVHAKSDPQGTMVTETHRMRPYSTAEVAQALASTGMDLIESQAWMGGPLTDDVWYATHVAKKK